MQNNIETDILVIGGGAAGVAAAVASARSGVKTILVERHSFFGGKATASIVGTICGLYLRNKNSESVFVTNGFAKEFAELLQKQSSTEAQHNAEGLHYLPYHPFVFKTLCDELLCKAGVEVFLHTTIHSCKTENGTIKSLSALAFDRQVTFEAKTIIDCSGEAIVSHLANLPIDESEEYQAAAQVFAMHHVDAENESALSLSIIRELTKGASANLISSDLLRTSIVPGSLSEKNIFLKIALPQKITHQFNSVSQLEIESRNLVKELVVFFQTNIAAFKNAKLGEVAMEAGVRTGRRPIGKYILTQQDVLSARKFDTGIANGAWPIEFWEPSKKVKMNYFAENDFYQIPADCLGSHKMNNLFFAGRNISADNDAIASARVIGTCLQTGYAAGKLAAAKVLNINQEKVIEQIRKENLL